MDDGSLHSSRLLKINTPNLFHRNNPNQALLEDSPSNKQQQSNADWEKQMGGRSRMGYGTDRSLKGKALLHGVDPNQLSPDKFRDDFGAFSQKRRSGEKKKEGVEVSLSLSLTLGISILLVSCFVWSGALLDKYDVLLSYSIVSLAQHITNILIFDILYLSNI